MGTEFFWFYDVILAAILIGMMFIGAKKGFVRMVLRLCAFAASFVIALMISNGVSGWYMTTLSVNRLNRLSRLL